MLDGILLERRGIPCVTIITDSFIPTGRAIARLWGVSCYEFVCVPHPIAHLDSDHLCQRTADLVAPVSEKLKNWRAAIKVAKPSSTIF